VPLLSSGGINNAAPIVPAPVEGGVMTGAIAEKLIHVARSTETPLSSMLNHHSRVALIPSPLLFTRAPVMTT